MPVNKKTVSDSTGYEFSNTALMEQAFTRRSYSQEKGGENNEILEFIGDKVLDLAVIILMMRKFGRITEEQTTDGKVHTYFRTTLNEGAFTEIKKDMVEKKALSRRMDILKLNDYLVMGQGDIRKHAGKTASVKEDLFEALLGAMAIDCDYDMKKLTETVARMVDFAGHFDVSQSTDPIVTGPAPASKKPRGRKKAVKEEAKAEETIAPIIPVDDTTVLKEWCEARHYRVPHYAYTKNSKGGWDAVCRIKEEKKEASGSGANKNEARKSASSAVYALLTTSAGKTETKAKNRFSEAVGELDETKILSQYNELVQKGIIKKYKFTYTSEDNPDGGTPIWKCRVDDPEAKGYATGTDVSKNKAKSKAILKHLNHLLKKEKE